MPLIKQAEKYTILCVNGELRTQLLGQDLLLIHGEQLEISAINGHHLLTFSKNKQVYKNILDLENGMILTCLKLVMEK